MGVFERMGRVLSANFNALLDKAEDPSRSLESMLGEMQEHLRGARRELVRAVAAERQLKTKLAEHDSEIQRWTARAELAIGRGSDDLARSALAQKRRVMEQKAHTEALAREQRDNVLELKAAYERMQQKLAELSARRGTIAAQARLAQGLASSNVSVPEALGHGSGQSPFAALADVEDRIDGVEAVFEAQREVDSVLSQTRGVTGLSDAEVEQRFLELERAAPPRGASSEPSNAIDEELAQLKKKVRFQP